MEEKFLTVFASFDEETQERLKCLQQILFENNLQGTQTTDIPFHISLGSFSLASQNMLEEKIATICSTQPEFLIRLEKISHFSDKVLFIKPQKSDMIFKLHKIFEGYFADNYNFTPHVTMLCADKIQIKIAKKLLKKSFVPFTAKITKIYLGEFFPAKILFESKLFSSIKTDI